jgi:hypothetical protein
MRFQTLSAGLAFVTIATAGFMLLSPRSEAANDNNPTQDEKLKIRIGQQIVPAIRLNLNGKDPNTVYLGSYLVNAIGCSDCHTNPQYIGNPFAGDPIRDQRRGLHGRRKGLRAGRDLAISHSMSRRALRAPGETVRDTSCE